MSLLNRGTDTVTVFAEEVTTDSDGNTLTRPSAVGVICRAVVQPREELSANTENMDGGFYTETSYRLRLVDSPGILWRSEPHRVEGQAVLHSRRCSHL